MQKAIAYFNGRYLAMVKPPERDIWEVIYSFESRHRADDWFASESLITWTVIDSMGER